MSARRGVRHPELDGPSLPLAAGHVWGWYCALVSTSGDDPIGYTDIEAFSRLVGVRPTPWDVAMIVRLDALGRKMTYDAMNRRRKG